MLSFANIRINEEKNRKSIPSKIFFNHFLAVSTYISKDAARFKLKSVDYYNKLNLKNGKLSVESLRKLLWNSWSTEYALTIAKQVNTPEYYKFALHWTFPQAYYSVYLNMTAFQETQGTSNDNHEKSIKIFSQSIRDGHYPKTISFLSTGLHESFHYHELTGFAGMPKGFSGLANLQSDTDVANQIALFLKTTREKQAESKRERAEAANDKKFFTKGNTFSQKFKKHQWDMIYQTMPNTTILNMLYRLRIKSNYLDIDTFVNAEIDFTTFHQCLLNIVDYLNFVHEAYVAKVIGLDKYKTILDDFPKHLNQDSATRRFNQHIKPLM